MKSTYTKEELLAIVAGPATGEARKIAGEMLFKMGECAAIREHISRIEQDRAALERVARAL